MFNYCKMLWFSDTFQNSPGACSAVRKQALQARLAAKVGEKMSDNLVVLKLKAGRHPFPIAQVMPHGNRASSARARLLRSANNACSRDGAQSRDVEINACAVRSRPKPSEGAKIVQQKPSEAA